MSAPRPDARPLPAPLAAPPSIVTIASLDQEGRGIARIDGKAVFVEGALPGETVAITTLKRKPTFDLARADAVLKSNAARVEPRCPHFGVCGGCSQQHFDAAAQVAAKQRTLEDALWRLGRVRPALLLPPIHGPAWEYRHRARLSVRHVVKKGGMLIGFHERKSSYVADMTSCAVLPRKISDLLPKLRALIGGLTVRDRLPQIELAVGDGENAAHVLVLRILEPLAPEDEIGAARIRRRARRAVLPAAGRTRHRGAVAARRAAARVRAARVRPRVPLLAHRVHAGQSGDQPGARAARDRARSTRAPASASPTSSAASATSRCRSRAAAARPSASKAAPRSSTRATRERRVQRTRGASATFRVANLFAATPESLEALGPLDKILIDPPREGAIALVKALPGDGAPERIVYVSCNPATLARDASVLVHDHGYDLAAAGVVNMFPHTSHVESIALFTR